MAVTTTNRIAGPFLGNGTATVFSFAFTTLNASDVAVMRTDPSGNLSVLVKDIDYRVTLNANQANSPGGSITLLTGPLGVAYVLSITTLLPQLQQLVLQNGGPFRADVIDAALDLLTILMQQVQLQQTASLKLALTDDLTGAQLPPASQRAGLVLGFDSSGNIQLQPPAQGGGVTPSISATATTLTPGAPATVTQSGTITMPHFTFGIPRGADGAAGANGATGLPGVLGANSGVKVLPSVPFFSPPTADATQNVSIDVNDTTYTNTGHGWTLGAFPYYTWYLTKSQAITVKNMPRGIGQAINVSYSNYAEGDKAAQYMYFNTIPSGIRTGADEATTGLTIEVAEWPALFNAQVATTTGTGDTQPTFTNWNGRSIPADGGCLVNITKGAISGTMAGYSAPYENYLIVMPFSSIAGGPTAGQFPQPTAWGQWLADDAYPSTGKPTSQYVSRTVHTIPRSIPSLTGGSPMAPLLATGIATLIGENYIEQVLITAASPTLTGGKQTVTYNARFPNTSGYLFQGGMAGQYMSFDANLAQTGKQTWYACGGSLDGTNLILAVQFLSSTRSDYTLPREGYESASLVVSGRAGAHFYPGAEVTAILDANNNNIIPGFILETNSVPWSVPDVVRCCDPMIWAGNTLWIKDLGYGTPISSYQGGRAVLVNSRNRNQGYDMVTIQHDTTFPGEYAQNGGPIGLPNGINILGGLTRGALRLEYAPQPLYKDGAAAVIRIDNSNASNTIGALWEVIQDNGSGGTFGRVNLNNANTMATGFNSQQEFGPNDNDTYWFIDKLLAYYLTALHFKVTDLQVKNNAGGFFGGGGISMDAGTYLNINGHNGVTQNLQINVPGGTATLRIESGIITGVTTP